MTDTLRLMETEPKKRNWKLDRADSIYRKYEEMKGVKLKVPYGMVMGLLTKISECLPTEDNNYSGWGWLNEETGVVEFDIPPIQDFEAQYRGFLNNDYAKKANYSLALFFRQFGNYEVVKEVVPLKVKPAVKETRVYIQCSDCGKAHWSNEKCKIETPEEINKILDQQFKKTL